MMVPRRRDGTRREEPTTDTHARARDPILRKSCSSLPITPLWQVFSLPFLENGREGRRGSAEINAASRSSAIERPAQARATHEPQSERFVCAASCFRWFRVRSLLNVSKHAPLRSQSTGRPVDREKPQRPEEKRRRRRSRRRKGGGRVEGTDEKDKGKERRH